MYVEKHLYICVFFLFVFTTDTGSKNIKIKQYPVDIGKNLSLPCPVQHNNDVTWIREGREDEQIPRISVQEDGSLLLMEVDKNDSGIYLCAPSNVVGDDHVAKMKVFVRTPPPPLTNVRIYASTILAVIMWSISGSGGYPIIYFTAQFRLADSEDEWETITPIHISPNSRQIDVYKLLPNTTYAFKIWACNLLGDSEVTLVYETTKITNEQAELERHFLQGVENFDTRVWVIAVGIVMGTLVILGFGTCFLMYQECRTSGDTDDQEVIELVPNIILNPGFDGESHTEHVPPDENSNNESTTRLNNNTVVQPRTF